MQAEIDWATAEAARLNELADADAASPGSIAAAMQFLSTFAGDMFVAGAESILQRSSRSQARARGIASILSGWVAYAEAGMWRIDDGGGGRHDDRVISLALAAHHLLTQPVRRHARIVVRS